MSQPYNTTNIVFKTKDIKKYSVLASSETESCSCCNKGLLHFLVTNA